MKLRSLVGIVEPTDDIVKGVLLSAKHVGDSMAEQFRKLKCVGKGCRKWFAEKEGSKRWTRRDGEV